MRLRRQREAAVYHEYMAMTADKSNSKVEVVKFLMRKYNVYGISTIYAWIHRAEKRIKEGQA